MREVYTQLKSLPGGLGLEKCSRVFESCGYLTLSSLKYLHPGDIDAFFPSPEKLLLAEKRIVESEIKGIVNPESRRTPLRPLELSQRLNSHSDTWQSYYASSSSSYQTAPSHQSLPLNILPTTAAACNTVEGSIAGGHEIKPLDRKRDEMKENLLVLHVQITSASGQLQKLKPEQQEFTSLAAIWGRICNRCHRSGHTKTTCKSSPCESINNCKIREKHPEIENKISSLQAELKELQKQHKKQTSELENFMAAREKSKSSFFSVMCNCLRLQNLPKYTDRLRLDKDLLVLQHALRNQVAQWKPEEGNWRLPMIIEQYHHAKVASYLPVQNYFVDGAMIQHQAGLNPTGGYPFS